MKPLTTSFLLKFKHDTLATVSRKSVQKMARKLGFNETQLVHLALARLRDQLLDNRERPAVSFGEEGDYPRLTEEQLAAIRRHAPKRRGKPVTSESLF